MDRKKRNVAVTAGLTAVLALSPVVAPVAAMAEGVEPVAASQSNELESYKWESGDWGEEFRDWINNGDAIGNWHFGHEWFPHWVTDCNNNGRCDTCGERIEGWVDPGDEKPEAPAAPTDAEIVSMLGDCAVQVECVTNPEGHVAVTYGLKDGTYNISTTMDADGTKGSATVTVSSYDSYVNEYNQANGKHELADNQADSQTISFTFERLGEQDWSSTSDIKVAKIQVCGCKTAESYPTADEVVALLGDDAVSVECVTEGSIHLAEKYALKAGSFGVSYSESDGKINATVTVSNDLYMDAYNGEYDEHSAVQDQATTREIKFSIERLDDGTWALSSGFEPASFKVECAAEDPVDHGSVTFKVTSPADGSYYEIESPLSEDGHVAAPSDPEVEGYLFTGWAVNGDPDNVFTSGAVANESSVWTDGTTFVAQFAPAGGSEDPTDEKVEVTFYMNYPDGTEASVTATADEDGKIAQPADPVCTGYVFTGWALNGDTDVMRTSGAVAWYIYEEDTYYVAQWVPAEDSGDPDVPVDPDDPSDPDVPVTPVDPTPGDDDEPDTPDTPVDPDDPSDPDTPGTDEPGTTDPDTPGTDDPDTPGTDTPDQPGDTQKPAGDTTDKNEDKPAIPNTGDATVAVSGIAGLGAALAGLGALIRRRLS